MIAKDHALFKRYPLDGTVELSTGPAPTPYHIYDGRGLFIGGTADLNAVRGLLQPESLPPAATEDGRALMGLWICDFREASLGPHHELQISIFVAQAGAAPVGRHALDLLALMLAGGPIRMMCHGLWNNRPVVVAYNREHLSLNARLARSRIAVDKDELKFYVEDAASREPVLSGALRRPWQSSLRAGLALVRRLGWNQAAALNSRPWVSMRVVNPVGAGLDRNAEAETFDKNDINAVRYFDPRHDQLTFGETPYKTLGFQPRFVEYMEGFKFVYLQPK